MNSPHKESLALPTRGTETYYHGIELSYIIRLPPPQANLQQGQSNLRFRKN